MFVERYHSSSALFTILLGWHTGVVNLPPGDVILAQLVLFTSEITNLSLYKHWLVLGMLSVIMSVIYYIF
jgi:hypothetical protein